jgi:hypothetical protein
MPPQSKEVPAAKCIWETFELDSQHTDQCLVDWYQNAGGIAASIFRISPILKMVAACLSEMLVPV